MGRNLPSRGGGSLEGEVWQVSDKTQDWLDGRKGGFEEGWQAAIEARTGGAEPCEACRGLGVRGYGSTSTWMGGPGGQILTQDTCDKCWGSGRADRPGLNLKHATKAIQALERLERRGES